MTRCWRPADRPGQGQPADVAPMRRTSVPDVDCLSQWPWYQRVPWRRSPKSRARLEPSTIQPTRVCSQMACAFWLSPSCANPWRAPMGSDVLQSRVAPISRGTPRGGVLEPELAPHITRGGYIQREGQLDIPCMLPTRSLGQGARLPCARAAALAHRSAQCPADAAILASHLVVKTAW